MSQYVYNKHNTTWKVLCTVFTHSLFLYQITLLVRCAHSFDFWNVNNSCVNTVRQHFAWSIFYIFFHPQIHRPHIDPTSTLDSILFFNTASWILKLYKATTTFIFPTTTTSYCFPTRQVIWVWPEVGLFGSCLACDLLNNCEPANVG